jgi:hypothetical protein
VRIPGRRRARALGVALAILALVSCTAAPERDRVETAGVGFDVPAGWSRLSPAELAARHSTVETMIGTADRSGLAFAMEIKGLLPQNLDCNPYGDEAPMRLAAIAAALESALPSRYSGYRLLRHGVVSIRGEPAVEIVYVGREGNEASRWRRIVVASPDSERVFMFGFSCPEGEDERYLDDLRFIETSLELPSGRG